MKNMSESNESVYAVNCGKKGRKNGQKRKLTLPHMSLTKHGNHVISVEISTSLRNLCVPHGGKLAKCVKEKIIFPKCVNRTKAHEVDYEEYDSSSSYEEHSTLVVELEQPDESCTNSVREVNALST